MSELKPSELRPWFQFRGLRVLRVFIGLAVAAVVLTEASTDLSQRPTLRDWIVRVDGFLVFGLLVERIVDVLSESGPWWRRLKRFRASLFYALLCILFFSWTPRVGGAFGSGRLRIACRRKGVSMGFG